LEDTENSIWNLLRAVEAGLFSESTKIRLDELETQKNELKTALAAAKLKENLGLKKEHILFFLHQLADMDLQDIDCQKRLIKTFVNSVFVYDDKVILTFNYSSDQRTITLKEIEAGLQECVRISPSDVHQKETTIFARRLSFLFVLFSFRSSLFSQIVVSREKRRICVADNWKCMIAFRIVRVRIRSQNC